MASVFGCVVDRGKFLYPAMSHLPNFAEIVLVEKILGSIRTTIKRHAMCN